MDDSYSNGLERITNDFNDRYGNISGIDKMYYYTSFDKQIMHCLRQALYYELYGNSDKLSNAPKLPYDETAIVFADNLKNAYDGVEDTVYIPLKMAAFVQKLSKNTSYDFSKYWNDALSDSLKSLLSELNVAHSYQTVYTINALFSDFSIKPDFSNKSAYQRNWMQHMRPIQQDINYYMTQSDHIQLAYGMGLIVPNGLDNQRYNYQSLRLHPAWPCSLLSMDLNLIYQDANGWSPMILYGKSVPNHLSINQKTEKWFRYMYYVNHEEVFNHDSITEDDIRNEFTFLDSKLAQNLELEPVTHLNLNVPNAVQAFALKQNENNIQQVYTLQYDNSTMSEVLHIGHINQNDSNKIHTCNFDETFTIGSDLAAHSQTLAPADDSYQSFFIGFFHNAFIKSKFKWATCLGLFDLANPDNQKNTSVYNE